MRADWSAVRSTGGYEIHVDFAGRLTRAVSWIFQPWWYPV